MMKLSVIIITCNEEETLRDCLESVAFADEVIVLDSGSTDRTVEIARSMGARLESTPDWPGFGPQKNRGLALATGDWVLSLDADERITPALKAEILSVLGNPRVDCYAIPRLSQFAGSFIRHSGWYPDYVARLFRRGTARFSDDLVHEKLIAEVSVAKLKNHILHLGFRDFSSTLRKIDHYSSAWSFQALAAGKKAGFFSALSHAIAAFLKTYILKMGFLDGPAGLAVAISSAEVAYYKYLKLWWATKRRK
jgi:glycosyltransferase involved in cell wall biosynthesis